MICEYHSAPGTRQPRTLLVMLPGAGMAADDFAAHGFIAALHAQTEAVDVAAACPALDLYLDGNVAAALHEGVVQPAVAKGYARIWLLGISLGGLGALLHASAYPGVAGLVLLAPFLGTPGTVAEIARSGGLPAWRAEGSGAVPVERAALLWLQRLVAAPAAHPALYLGFGHADRFAAGHRLLADCLPARDVVTGQGGHDWPSWSALWHEMLARPALRGGLDAARGAPVRCG